MTQNIDDLEWISLMIKKHCDGDWEHENGVSISSTSSPGWSMVVELRETKAETLSFDSGLIKNSEEDWYTIKVENVRFEASGDLMKLSFIIKTFRQMMEKCGETI